MSGTQNIPPHLQDPQSITLEQIEAQDLIDIPYLLSFWLKQHVSEENGLRARVTERVERALSKISLAELRAIRETYLACGQEYRFYPADPFGRHLGREFVGEVAVNSGIRGLENLNAAVSAGPTLLVSNHLSYADSQLTDAILHSAGEQLHADRLVFIAGPKVYDEPFRRMGALSLNTLPTAQSTRLQHNQAKTSAKEVARIALETLKRAGELMNDGYLVLLYAEGARSRTGRLGSFLKATVRYAGEAAHVVPVSLSGSNRTFPLHQRVLRATRLSLCFGAPITVEGGGATAAMEKVWHSIADELPKEHKPLADTPPFV